MHLLIVEDEPTNRKLLRVRMEAEGYRVTEAPDGAAGLDLLRSGTTVDAVISDILMPNLDGFRFCRALRQDPALRHLPFILYTATYDSKSDRDLATACGVDAYVVKPAPVQEILQALADAARIPRDAPPTSPDVDEGWVLGQYSEALVNKLETKNEELTRALTNLGIAHEEIVALNRDLEARVEQRTRELREANAQLEKALAVKDQFIASISHELRTPLTAVLLTAERIRTRASDGTDADLLGAIQTVINGGEHLLALINDLIDIASLASGEIRLQPEPVDIGRLGTDTVDTLHELARSRSISLTARIASDMPPVVGDERRIRQILFNLLGNAIKFTPEGGRAWLEAAHVNGATVLRVGDTGPGIPAEQMERVFQPFERGRATGSRSEGTGLGLALVDSLTRAMGGRIEVASRSGRGTEFTVTLPLASLSDSGTKSTDETGSDTPASARPRVLVVEDNEILLKSVTEYLRVIGYPTHALDTGSALLDLIARQETADGAPPFDVILMDMQMPGADGFACLQALKASAWFAPLPVIATTGRTMPQDRDDTLAAGASSFLPKPFRLTELIRLINVATGSQTPE